MSYTRSSTSSGLINNSVKSLAIDLNGNKWIGTDGGISKFDGSKWTNYRPDGSSYDPINSIAVDGNNNIWFGTLYGVKRFDGYNWITYDLTNGLISNYINCISIDLNGNKWIATDKGISELFDGGAGPLNTSLKSIRGEVFIDKNINGLRDKDEKTLSNQIVKIINDNSYISTADSVFYILRNNGTYNIKYTPPLYWMLTTDSIKTIVIQDSSNSQFLQFGIAPSKAIQDYSINITGSRTRINAIVPYVISFENKGTIDSSIEITVVLDSSTSLKSSSPSFTKQNGDSLFWNYSSLGPLEKKQIKLLLNMPGAEFLNDTIITKVIISPQQNDKTPDNNLFILRQILTGPYDPNDKSVDKGVGKSGYTQFGEELAYTIGFQNTGSDTAYVVNIKDTLSTNLIIESLNLQCSSHNVTFSIKEKNIVVFHFDNIMLPNSMSDEPGSHGFIKYSIKPKSNLPEESIVKNKAYIYFEDNPAIITNETINTYVSTLNNYNSIKYPYGDELKIFPNPFNFETILTLPLSEVYNLYITDLSGKNIYQIKFQGNQYILKKENLTSGIYILNISNEQGLNYKAKLVIF